LIFQLGTNNWQTDDEPAPGSGILHEAHHVTFNKLLEGCTSYSVYPSFVHEENPARTKCKVVKLPHKVPICESVSPTSDKKWHGMTDDEIEVYLERIETVCYKYMKECEEAEGQDITFVVAHHTFTNPLVMMRINKRRIEEGKKAVPVVSFCHGTAIKMYENELAGEASYPLRFHPMMEKLGVFSDQECGVQVVITISEENLESFQTCFPNFPAERAFVSMNGYDPLTFFPDKKATLAETLSKFKMQLMPGVTPPSAAAGASMPKSQAPKKAEGTSAPAAGASLPTIAKPAPAAGASAPKPADGAAAPKLVDGAAASKPAAGAPAPAEGAKAAAPTATGAAAPMAGKQTSASKPADGAAAPKPKSAAGAAGAAAPKPKAVAGASAPAEGAKPAAPTAGTSASAPAAKPVKGPAIPGSKYSKMVLFVGKFADWKRLDAVLQSAKVYEESDPQIVTVIAGTGGPKDILKYHSMAYETLGLKNTYFVGSMNQKQLRELCTVADIGVFPSKKEPFGMVFIECMACGTPVIGAASGGPLSFVTEEVGTLVPESADIASFSKVLCKTIMQALQEDWKTEKKAACLELVEAFTMEKQCKQIRDKVLALCKKNKGDKVDEETRAKVRAYYKFLNSGGSDPVANYYSALEEERLVGG